MSIDLGGGGTETIFLLQAETTMRTHNSKSQGLLKLINQSWREFNELVDFTVGYFFVQDLVVSV